MSWHNLFIPHRETHEKAKLVSWHALAIYLLLFILLQVGMDIFSYANPGVLGTTTNIQEQRLIELTNEERAKAGLGPLVENSSLDHAAAAKAANMFEENYWAHFAPSGKSPWDFMAGAGYKFTFAGENLAKNFTSAEDVVAAWMASPSHRENLLNPKYKEIGFAIEDGTLEGNQTTLVVQMFGTATLGTSTAVAQVNHSAPPAFTSSAPTVASANSTPTPTVQPVVVVGGQEVKVSQEKLDNAKPLALLQPVTAQDQKPLKPPLFNPFKVSRVYSILVLCGVMLLLVLDFVILRHRGVFRLSSNHIAHLSVLFLALIAVILAKPGGIL